VLLLSGKRRKLPSKRQTGVRLKAKGLQNFASVVGGAAVFSSLAQLPEPYQSFTSEISLSIG
jgi:hypothetical protein